MKNLLELIVEYGTQMDMAGYHEGNAEAFEGDDDTVSAHEKDERRYRSAARSKLNQIRKLLGHAELPKDAKVKNE